MITQDEVVKAISFTESVLNKIDIKGFAADYGCQTINDLISDLEQKYDETEITKNNYMEGHLFNWMNEDEFIDYLYRRYKGFSTSIETITYINF